MQILNGYISKDKAYKVDDYPYGFRLRTSIFYWIETKKGTGDRFCSYTINPKTGRPNKPKCGTYSTFLYMYINEEGHVKCGSIDAYNREEFEARFEFILHKIGEVYLSDIQKQNIRVNYYQHMRANAPYQIVKYSEEKKEEFKKWIIATLKHIQTCEFKELVNHPAKPVYDNPDGEVKMVVTEREEKPEQPLEHSITIEKVTGILNKVLPGFCVECSEWKGYDIYLKISMAASSKNINGVEGQKPQRATLSLNLKTLVLKPQQYGGNGGQWIYRKPHPTEKYLAMQRVKIPFRTPACNDKDVLAAIERFAVHYKNTLIENRGVLMYQDIVDYDLLLNKTA